MSKLKDQVQDNIRANTRFIDVLQHFLNRGLQSWAQNRETANRDSFEGMYEYIEHSIMELFSKVKNFNLAHDTKRWIAQKLYLSIQYKPEGAIEMPDGSHLQSVPKVFQEVDIMLIPSDELRLIGGLLSDCEFAPEIAKEIRRRA